MLRLSGLTHNHHLSCAFYPRVWSSAVRYVLSICGKLIALRVSINGFPVSTTFPCNIVACVTLKLGSVTWLVLANWVVVNWTQAKAWESVCTLALSLSELCHCYVNKPKLAYLEDERLCRSDPNCLRRGHPNPPADHICIDPTSQIQSSLTQISRPIQLTQKLMRNMHGCCVTPLRLGCCVV